MNCGDIQLYFELLLVLLYYWVLFSVLTFGQIFFMNIHKITLNLVFANASDGLT